MTEKQRGTKKSAPSFKGAVLKFCCSCRCGRWTFVVDASGSGEVHVELVLLQKIVVVVESWWGGELLLEGVLQLAFHS